MKKLCCSSLLWEAFYLKIWTSCIPKVLRFVYFIFFQSFVCLHLFLCLFVCVCMFSCVFILFKPPLVGQVAIIGPGELVDGQTDACSSPSPTTKQLTLKISIAALRHRSIVWGEPCIGDEGIGKEEGLYTALLYSQELCSKFKLILPMSGSLVLPKWHSALSTFVQHCKWLVSE